jgi:hypothetical protein
MIFLQLERLIGETGDATNLDSSRVGMSYTRRALRPMGIALPRLRAACRHSLSLSETLYGWRAGANRVMLVPMVDGLVLLGSALTSLFRSRARLEAEILVLQQQINVLRRTSPTRFVFGTFDRLVFAGLYRVVPGARSGRAVTGGCLMSPRNSLFR